MRSRGIQGSWRWLRLVLSLLAAAHGPHAFLGQCSEDSYVQGVPQVRVVEDDLAIQCAERCTCYHSLGRDRSGPARAMVLHVDCSQRGLTDFPVDIPRQAYTLDMSGNKLINMTSLPPLADLRELDLSDNWLRHIDNKWVFEHSPRLRLLRLSENRLRSVQHGSFSGLQQLEELDLSMNILTSLDTHALAGLEALQILRLDRNQLYDFSRDWFMSLTSLIELHASHNHISALESHVLDRISHLQHLDLSQNALRLIRRDAFVGMANLKLLNLSSNTQLETFPSDVLGNGLLPRLDILLADDTNLQRLQPYAVANLSVAEMSLSFMPRLRVIEKFAFFNCSRLHTLQIHDNPQLIFIHPLSFSSLPSLQRLLIHNNGLIAVPMQIVQSLPSLVDLQLHHNPLHCDCNSYWLREELSRHQKHYHREEHGAYRLSGRSTNQTTSSSTSMDTTAPPTSSNETASSTTPLSIKRPFIREPDRVACFFPSTQQTRSASQPMIQLAIQYFSPTCPPSVLSLFPAAINTTLGNTLQLECHGLGVPTPDISWLLPNGVELNSSTPQTASMMARFELTDGTLLTIKDIRTTDAGMYGCTASNSLGQDLGSVIIHVHNKPLDIVEVQVGYDYVTVGLVGRIPRLELGDFQIYYRESNHEAQAASPDHNGAIAQLSSNAGFRVLRLRPHGSFHTAMIRDLKPHTPYQVCLVYKDAHLVSCKTWTTLNVLRVVHTPRGIVRISKTQVVVAIVGSVLAVVLLLVVVALVKRRGKTSGYHDSVGTRDEKASIPLDGMLSNPANPSLTSSRTALLSNSHV